MEKSKRHLPTRFRTTRLFFPRVTGLLESDRRLRVVATLDPSFDGSAVISEVPEELINAPVGTEGILGAPAYSFVITGSASFSFLVPAGYFVAARLGVVSEPVLFSYSVAEALEDEFDRVPSC